MAEYGHDHRKARRAAKPAVLAGRAYCAELICLEANEGRTRWIRPDSEWDMAHDRTRPGHYLGPAHARCNRSEGARHRDRVARLRITRRHSRDW